MEDDEGQARIVDLARRYLDELLTSVENTPKVTVFSNDSFCLQCHV
jgi:hypothetical protein